ncbi:MAG: transcriptional regulator [Actinomycetota bacterium]|nr:transcriptional regulator [Actinomycetota bacterium]
MSTLDRELSRRRETATSTQVQVPATSSTHTITDLVEEAGVVRTSIRFLRDEVDELHQDAGRIEVSAFETELAQATAEEAKRDIKGLLKELGSTGFSWREVARAAGVSLPAVHKWKAGGGLVPENRRRIARLVALCRLLSERFFIEDVAAWLEMPLVPEAPVNGLDLLARDRIDLLFRWAAHADADPQAILDEFEPNWREAYKSDYEVFTAPDGLPGIRFRER